ncbi:DUF4097 domain-containing protein [Kineosporia rhizophila]|uniref:DUF4097 family beta strand repeat-containing protein n=1 Tax=Kineosporia TaxID=49184 RepID=UPI001E5110F9|nr:MULTISPECIES: DUF4097 family beta strand repeat-containing protein [Kineosporia]MCE0539017.1 DUF4097 domain-containing protein [Kineosporia rhizophila]GLY17881.1 hypothetical protein Kisp01_48950 [Kineosporia sp. NBRC 101677]
MPTTTFEPGSPEAKAEQERLAAAARRRSPWTGPVRIATVVLGAGVIGMGTISVVTLFATRVSTESLTVTDRITAMRVDVESGDVVIRDGAPGDPVTLEVRTTSSLTDARWTHSVQQGVLALEGGCSGGWPIDNCSVDYQVVVPPDVKVDVTTGAGDATVTGLTGATKVRTGSGDIRLGTIGGDIEARTGSGDLRATQLDSARAELRTGSGDLSADFTAQTTQVRARTGSGDIRTSFSVAPPTVELRTGSGDVGVSLPQDGTSYDVTGHTGSGDRKIDVPTGSAKNRISATTGSGDVHIGFDWKVSSRPSNG